MADGDSYQAWRDRCERYFTSISESESVKNGSIDRNKHPKKWRTLRDVTSDDFTKSDATSNIDRAKQWFSAVDIHGLRLAGAANNALETIIWIIVPCVAFGCFVFFMYLNLSVYSVQSSSYRTDTINSRLAESPFVTVCNKNKLRFSVVATSSGRFQNLLALKEPGSVLTPVPNKNGSEAIRSTIVSSFAQNLLNKAEFDEMMSGIDASFVPFSYMASPNDWSAAFKASLKHGFQVLQRAVSPNRKEYSEYGHQPNKSLVQCLLDGQPCKGVIQELIDENYGRCFTLSPSTTNALGELELILNIEPDEYINPLSPAHGAIILLHTKEYDVIDGARHLVAPGSHYVIDLQKIVTVKKQTDCTSRPDYKRENCMSTCIDSFSHTYCKCRQSLESDNAFRCRLNVQFEFVCHSTLVYLASKGKLPCSCPYPCSTTTVETKETSLPWPSDGSLKHVQQYLQNHRIVMTAEQTRSSILKLTINTQNAKETRIEEDSASSLLQLLANIGGVSSLLIGVSIISVVEVMWLTIRTCTVGCLDYYNRKQRRDKNMEKLSDSDFTSVTWAAYKDRLRYDAQVKDETIGRKGLWSQEPIRRNGGRRQPLKSIPEETKSAKTYNVKDSITATGGQSYPSMPTKYTNHNRYPSQARNTTSTRQENQARGNQFPLFHSLDLNTRPWSFTSKNMENRGVSTSLPMNSAAEQYPERGRIVSPADAIQMYGPSTRKYYVSEPYNV